LDGKIKNFEVIIGRGLVVFFVRERGKVFDIVIQQARSQVWE